MATFTVASFKGGTGKTTAAVHLAGYLARKGPTILIDGDSNRSATAWGLRGKLLFKIADEGQGHLVRGHTHTVIDTAARPSHGDLAALAKISDLVIVPTTPDALSLHATMALVAELRNLGATFKVLLTIVPPSRDAEEARVTLQKAGIPMFRGELRRRVAYQRAALAGILVSDVHDPRAAEAWSDVQSIGRELLK